MPWSGTVEEIKRGNHCGGEPLYTAVVDCARAYLFQNIDPQLVEDYLQEILMIVISAIRSGELRDPRCLMGFVHTVTRRQVALHIRRSILRRRRLVPVESATPLTASAGTPETQLAVRERVKTLRKLLDRLCPRDREILVRFYYEEQDSQRICREMRLTPTQFRLYKSRALAKCGKLAHSRRSVACLAKLGANGGR